MVGLVQGIVYNTLFVRKALKDIHTDLEQQHTDKNKYIYIFIYINVFSGSFYPKRLIFCQVSLSSGPVFP